MSNRNDVRNPKTEYLLCEFEYIVQGHMRVYLMAIHMVLYQNSSLYNRISWQYCKYPLNVTHMITCLISSDRECLLKLEQNYRSFKIIKRRFSKSEIKVRYEVNYINL